MQKNKMTLIAEVPDNDVGLADVATHAGADVLLLRINTHSLNDFETERDNLEKLLAHAKVPVGLSAGWEKLLRRDELAELDQLGFDFINIGIEHLSSSMVGTEHIAKVLKLNSRFSLDDIVEVSRHSYLAMDAAIVPTSGWGRDLIVGDLQNYISIVLSSALPIIVPTQRLIKASEVAIISDTGARGLILTPVVCGTSAKHLRRAVAEFRGAIDALEN